MQNPSTSRTSRVAVVGVHGIGKHEPGATANAMADLLLSLPSYNPYDRGANTGTYFDSFRSVGIHIPLRPVKAKPTEIGIRRPHLLGLYEEKSTTFARKASAFVKQSTVKRGLTGNAYTQLLLEQYQGGAGGDFYATNRLEGRRNKSAVGSEAEVHIYEVLWADLARPTNSFLSFFLALFQLILHLGSLSRLAIDSGAAERTESLWDLYRAMQRYSVRMLQIALPLLKLILLVALVACVPTVFVELSGARWLPPTLGALVGLAIGLLIENKLSKPLFSGPWLWAITALLPALAGAWAADRLSNFASYDGVVAIELWILVGASLFSYVLAKYEGVRKGAKVTGWVVYLLTFAVFLICLRLTGDVQKGTFWTAEWILAGLRFSWWILFAFAFLALGLGSIAWRSVKNEDERSRARAAVRTSRFALALPSLLFVQVTALIWAALFFFERKFQRPLFPPSGYNSRWQAWLVSLTLVPDPNGTIIKEHQNYLKGVLAWSVGYHAPASLALFLLAFLLIGCWIFPGVITERFPLRDQQKPPRNSTNRESSRLGYWLSRGLDATSISTFLFWCAMFVMPIAYYFFPVTRYQTSLQEATFWLVTEWIVFIAGALLAAMVKYGSPVLGAVLDVDNYLRTEPADATPRAKIFERYVSVLRYIARYRDPDGQPYDTVVIVAHSLGTLISADLLRYLRVLGDEELAPMGLSGNKKATMKIKLLTMGSPIRQLLNRFFPYLYDWVRDVPDNGLHPLPRPIAGPPPTIVPNARPDPAELGLIQWMNMYRSGDYVGRSLWLTEWYRRTDGDDSHGAYPEPAYKAQDGLRSEMCIGAGAHTHYWDDTAPDVAETLNSLI